ncbi:hypothetical protein AB0F46_39895 [Streptomyces sp. NPDC026665]
MTCPISAFVAEVFTHLGFQSLLQNSPGDLRQQPTLTEQGRPGSANLVEQ